MKMKFVGGTLDGQERDCNNITFSLNTETYSQFRIRGKDQVYPIMVLNSLHPDHVVRMLIKGYVSQKPIIEPLIEEKKIKESGMWFAELREVKEDADIVIKSEKCISLETCKRWSKKLQTVDPQKYFMIYAPSGSEYLRSRPLTGWRIQWDYVHPSDRNLLSK